MGSGMHVHLEVDKKSCTSARPELGIANERDSGPTAQKKGNYLYILFHVRVHEPVYFFQTGVNDRI